MSPWAEKMDGAKVYSRYHNQPAMSGYEVWRRCAWKEVGSRDPMDRAQVQILVVVAAKNGENPFRRKSKGSWPMFVRPGVVDPKWKV